MQSDMFTAEPEVFKPSGPVNAYPSPEQLKSIAALPLSYDITIEVFRAYYTYRTGVSFIGDTGVNTADHMIQIDSQSRIQAEIVVSCRDGSKQVHAVPDRSKWRWTNVDRRHSYQHVWNVWISQDRPDYISKLADWRVKCKEVQKRRKECYSK